MARLEPVALPKATDDIRAVYAAVFGDKDPVAEPGTATGSSGDWWTVMALVPELLATMTAQFAAFNAGKRELAESHRELAIVRAGFASGSRFVFSQHSKAARAVGLTVEQVAAIPAWAVADCFDAEQRAVLAYVDDLVLQYGRVQDATFEALRGFLSEVAVLELTIVAATYHLHAIVSRALRLEFDDVGERVTEDPAPAGFADSDLLVLLRGE